MNIVKVPFLLVNLMSFSFLFSQEKTSLESQPAESAESQMLTVIKLHFGSDRGLQKASGSRFSEAKELVAYLSHSNDVSLPAGTSFVDSFFLIDETKSSSLKKIFGCEGEAGELDSDEISERREVIGILVGLGLNSCVKKMVTGWAEKKRLLNLVKDDLAGGNDIQAQEANQEEIRTLHAQVRTFADGLREVIQNHQTTSLSQVNDDEDQLEQAQACDDYTGDMQKILLAILNDE